MIQAKFYYDSSKAIRAFEFSGHAGYADHGFDIVCAAVSAISQTVIGTIDELVADKPKYELDNHQARIYCEIPSYEVYTDQERVAVSTLMFSCLIGIKQLLPHYGEYIEIHKQDYWEA